MHLDIVREHADQEVGADPQLEAVAYRADLQVPKLPPHLGKAPLLDTPYGCAEGLLNVPLHDGKNGHPPHPGANIVEPLPDDADATSENLIPLRKAEKGLRREIFLTTSSGLARHRLHEIAQRAAHRHRAPRIAFCCESAFVLKVASTVIPEFDLASVLLDSGCQGHDDLLAGPNPSGASVAVQLLESSGLSPDAGAPDNALRKNSNMCAHEHDRGLPGDIESCAVPDVHAMRKWRNRPPAKERSILKEAPSGISRPAPAPTIDGIPGPCHACRCLMGGFHRFREACLGNFLRQPGALQVLWSGGCNATSPPFEEAEPAHVFEAAFDEEKGVGARSRNAP